MADDITFDARGVPESTVIKTDELSGGEHVPYSKIMDGTADSEAVLRVTSAGSLINTGKIKGTSAAVQPGETSYSTGQLIGDPFKLGDLDGGLWELMAIGVILANAATDGLSAETMPDLGIALGVVPDGTPLVSGLGLGDGDDAADWPISALNATTTVTEELLVPNATFGAAGQHRRTLHPPNIVLYAGSNADHTELSNDIACALIATDNYATDITTENFLITALFRLIGVSS